MGTAGSCLRSARQVALSVVIAGLLLETEGRADEDKRFGAKGQVIVTADRLLPVVGYTAQTVESTDSDTVTRTTDTGLSLAFFVGREPALGAIHTVPRLAVDVTPIPRLTLGTSLVFAFGIDGTHLEERTPKNEPATKRENANPGATILGFAPRVGYVVPLGKSFAFWPRAGLAFYSVSSQREATNNQGVTSTATETDTTFALDLEPQFVWTPVPNVIAFAGPLANIPLTGTHETSFQQGATEKDRSDDLMIFHVGVHAGLGFWFDL